MRIFFLIIFLFFYKKEIESKNLTVNINQQQYNIIYDLNTVVFSDLDPFRIAYHANHVKYCGNSIIRYFLKLSLKNKFKIKYLIKNVNISYFSPLLYDEEFKIIGAITNYGNTSLQITLFGINSKDSKTNENSDIRNILLSSLNWNNELEYTKKSVDNILSKYDEDTDNALNFNSEDLFKLSEKKSCKILFSAIYTLVQIDEKLVKMSISDSFKKENLPMRDEHLKQLSEIFC